MSYAGIDKESGSAGSGRLQRSAAAVVAQYIRDLSSRAEAPGRGQRPAREARDCREAAAATQEL